MRSRPAPRVVDYQAATITTQPEGGQDPASISVVAEGSPTLTYQWQRADTEMGEYSDVAQATGPELATPAAGWYRCRVTNAKAAVATSNSVQVTTT